MLDTRRNAETKGQRRTIQQMGLVRELNRRLIGKTHSYGFVLLTLVSHRGESGQMNPGQELLSEETGYSEQQVCEALKFWRELGVVIVLRKGNVGRCTEYDFDEDRAKELRDNFDKEKSKQPSTSTPPEVATPAPVEVASVKQPRMIPELPRVSGELLRVNAPTTSAAPETKSIEENNSKEKEEGKFSETEVLVKELKSDRQFLQNLINGNVRPEKHHEYRLRISQIDGQIAALLQKNALSQKPDTGTAPTVPPITLPKSEVTA